MKKYKQVGDYKYKLIFKENNIRRKEAYLSWLTDYDSRHILRERRLVMTHYHNSKMHAMNIFLEKIRIRYEPRTF